MIQIFDVLSWLFLILSCMMFMYDEKLKQKVSFKVLFTIRTLFLTTTIFFLSMTLLLKNTSLSLLSIFGISFVILLFFLFLTIWLEHITRKDT